MEKIKIGILGGSGFYEFLENPKEVEIKTPYGAPSDKIAVGEYQGVKIAFLPRHAKGHKLPPHIIPYRANIWALRELGVKNIISPAAVGSLKPEIAPGTFVICDDFLDRTKRRVDTFYDGPEVYHIPSTEIYCPRLRGAAVEICRERGVGFKDKGTVVVIEGPRFSSKPESKYYAKLGADIINMTQYPEVVLARELGMCYLGIGLVTDWDVGLEGNSDIRPVTADEVVRVFKENNNKVKDLIFNLIPKIAGSDMDCECAEVLRGAKI
ncbi:S-methyl-5'-thioadenosine phosphorylase [Patescibacteria group bacterium]|nr:S-methyl-5'-thioadenosine phosphorylase [Patescibacteria group bacterium]MBU1922350.1 S-methyl-5'-thioadenosine phosphorylase [Patescibacteria group bacterium]